MTDFTVFLAGFIAACVDEEAPKESEDFLNGHLTAIEQVKAAWIRYVEMESE